MILTITLNICFFSIGSKGYPMKITVLGAGAWGTALAIHFAQQNHQVCLWARNAEHVTQMQQTRENQRYLKNCHFPDNLNLQNHLQDALHQTELVLIVTPVSGLRPILEAIQPFIDNNMPIMTACKGFEVSTGQLPHQVVTSMLPEQKHVALLSGPSFAQELAQQLPCAVTLASENQVWIEQVCRDLNSPVLRLYASTDVIGVAVGGALKNVMAIATGLCDGLHYGLNARAALMTRGLAEISRLAQHLGAQEATLMGLSGLGDLILTCTGGLSRNRQVGLKLAEDKNLDTILEELGHVAEGVYTISEAYRLSQLHHISMPITETLFQLLNGQLNSTQVAYTLMMRSPTLEHKS